MELICERTCTRRINTAYEMCLLRSTLIQLPRAAVEETPRTIARNAYSFLFRAIATFLIVTVHSRESQGSPMRLCSLAQGRSYLEQLLAAREVRTMITSTIARASLIVGAFKKRRRRAKARALTYAYGFSYYPCQGYHKSRPCGLMEDLLSIALVRRGE